MVMLSMRFRIPWLAAKLMLTGKDGRVDTRKVDAYYDRRLLEELRDYPGLKWKIWAVSRDGRHGSGFYLFEDEAAAEIRAKYARKFYKRKGMLFTRCHISEVAEGSSRFTRAPIDVPANPPMTKEQAEKILKDKPRMDIRELVNKYKATKRVM